MVTESARYLEFIYTKSFEVSAKGVQAARGGMMTRRTGIGAQIIAAMHEAVEIERGVAEPARARKVALTARSATVERAPEYDRDRIARIREGLALSQPVFADVMNVSADTVRAWEQGKRAPDGAAVRLLQVAEEHPRWLLEKVRKSIVTSGKGDRSAGAGGRRPRRAK